MNADNSDTEVQESTPTSPSTSLTPKHIVIDGRIRRTSTGRYVDRLLEHLQEIDDTNQYTILIQPDDPWQPRAGNFAREDCPLPQFSFNPLHQIKFANQLKRLNADLAHFPMNQQPLLYSGKVVTTTMDLTMLRFTRPGRSPLPVFWLKMAGYRLLFWLSNKKSEAIITITNYVKEDLEENYPFTKGKITVTHCASEPPLSAPAEPVPGIEKPFIFYVGTAFPHKNLEKLVDAFGMIRAYHPDLSLVLAGKKEYYYEHLEKYAAESAESEAIKITGFVSDEQLKWLYENAEAYVFPSLSEGFGLPGLEAMVHGCPVVSSDASCLPEIHGDAAHYFDPHDPNDIAVKVTEVLDNSKLRAQLMAKGFKQAEKFSWREMAEKTLAVYKKALE